MKILPEHFEQLLAELGEGLFDLVLVGDGSGSTPGMPAGWACFAYLPEAGAVWEEAGAVSTGTVNYAEMAPYIHTLWAYHSREGRKKKFSYCPTHVLIVTDSELVARCWSGEYETRENLSCWAALRWFEANGYEIAIRHARRNSSPLAKEADRRSKLMRVGMRELGREIQQGGA